MVVVSAGAGDDVHGSAGGDAGGEIEVGAGDLKLFDNFLGEDYAGRGKGFALGANRRSNAENGVSEAGSTQVNA